MNDLINNLKTEIELNNNIYVIMFREAYLEESKVVKVIADTKDKANNKFHKWCENSNIEPYDWEYEIVEFEDINEAEIITQ